MTTFEIEEREPRLPFFADLYANFWKEASPDLQACMLAGCEMEYESKVTDEGIRLTVRTKHKVAVVRHPDGRVTVYVQNKAA